jgi:hypothetical protein
MASWTNAQLESFLFLTDNQDMAAIDQMIKGTTPLNDQATALKDDWTTWFDGLGWYAKNVDTATYDLARNKRNAFVIANTPDAATQAIVQKGVASAFTEEEAEGGTKRSLSTGFFKIPPVPLIPTPYKVAAVVGAISVGTLVVLKKLYIL